MINRIGVVSACIAVLVSFYWIGVRLADGLPGASAGARSHPERVRDALDNPDAISRTLELSSVLSDMRRDDLADVVAVYEARIPLNPPQKTSIKLLGEAWSAFDPEGAIERLSTWPAELGRPGIASVAQAWARRSAFEAFAWVSALPPLDRSAAIDSVFQGWAESGDPEVWGFLASLSPGLDRESATTIVMKTIIQDKGFEALFEQVDEIETQFEPGSPRDFKLSALRSALGLCAYHDPERALMIALRYAGGPYDNGLLRRVAVYWASHDGAGAMNAYVALPSGAQRDKALRDGYLKWLRTDGAAALDWMPNDAAADEHYAPIVDLFVAALANRDTEDPTGSVRQAAAWADRITDTQIRHNAWVVLGVAWFNLEPGSAQPWIDERGISDAVESERIHQVTARKMGEAAMAKRPKRQTEPNRSRDE